MALSRSRPIWQCELKDSTWLPYVVSAYGPRFSGSLKHTKQILALLRLLFVSDKYIARYLASEWRSYRPALDHPCDLPSDASSWSLEKLRFSSGNDRERASAAGRR